MKHDRSSSRSKILEPAVRSGILAAPLILMLAIIVLLSNTNSRLPNIVDHTMTSSIAHTPR
ncbi:hypothetical protein IL60_0212645 [Brucella inopinata BO1]|uniref:Uncharacterized protein n=1 Tax=Brucella ceti str. Cudo TaxID=595497 RepID=C0G659_9HYPH|nr:hypothetical protein IY71_04795 [Brucella suis]AIN90426.1 hypothetical protein DM30_04780 [Brucella abortus]AOG34609.1 hypothetical protein BFL29_04425 [Brucella canis]AOG43653.1 hypothetical protein BFS01_04685 [Brucella sp. 2002734562]AOG49709.1 hypothetical protein BFL33_04615 [Brucella melitensis]EEH14493.1 Hypothetical protein, conserved [Brucella ceti str. Cudo]EFM60708.1 Hypothetical protein BIBO2_0273 [Brucella sp. BO2]EFM61190.1 Hypothetical protein BROD_2891 [Brucella sp. NF 265